jgi:hypothetical protein
MFQGIKSLNKTSVFATMVYLAFTLWSVFWFWSLVLIVRPEAVITEWERNNNEDIEQVLALKMLTRLEQSIVINPLDANSHLLMARYYEALAHNKQKNKLNTYSKHAEQAYKLATQHQPSWDYSWAREANFYSNEPKLNEKAFIHAISKAMLLGPYERKTQEIIISLIFKHWILLSKNKSAQITKIIKHALKYDTNAPLVISSAIKYQQLAELRPLLTKKWQKNRLKKALRERKK